MFHTQHPHVYNARNVYIGALRCDVAHPSIVGRRVGFDLPALCAGLSSSTRAIDELVIECHNTDAPTIVAFIRWLKNASHRRPMRRIHLGDRDGQRDPVPVDPLATAVNDLAEHWHSVTPSTAFNVHTEQAVLRMPAATPHHYQYWAFGGV